jgi:predicted RND superfamily exporter protein
VGLLPALLPNLVVLGTLGWTGTPVNLGAAMIAAVSMGLGVDSSLHSLFRFQLERRSGRSVREALRVVQSRTGLAVVMATLALVLGFGSMAFSNFLPTVTFGTLAAWTMLGGLVGNVCLLPAFLVEMAGEEHDATATRGTA